MIPDYLKAVGAVLLPNIGGMVGSQWTSKNNLENWYGNLKFPPLRPPNWLFGPVWTSLYSGMGYASYMVWRDGGGFTGDAKLPLMVYGAQLALNFAWTPIFFRQHNIKAGLIDIAALTAVASTCGILFFKINPTAGYIFIPYIAWLSFATYLNFGIWKLNPETKDHAK